jgi:hypothetical protein
MPENTLYVGRPGEFGNPFVKGDYVMLGKGGSGWAFLKCLSEEHRTAAFTLVKDNAHAVELYKEYLKRFPLRKEKIEKLKGKNLACWCKEGDPCHADVLLEMVSSYETPTQQGGQR